MDRRPQFLVCVGLVVATIAAGATLILRPHCAACGDGSIQAQSFMAIAGGLSYSLALVLLAFPRTYFLGALQVAAMGGAHAVLVKGMFDASALCPACLIAAGGCCLAAAALLAGKATFRLAGVTAIFLGIVGSTLSLPLLEPAARGELTNELPDEYVPVLRDAKAACDAHLGSACIVIFEADGCAACDLLKDPAERSFLEQRFGAKVSLTRRPVPEGLRAPTVVIGSAEGWSGFWRRAEPPSIARGVRHP